MSDEEQAAGGSGSGSGSGSGRGRTATAAPAAAAVLDVVEFIHTDPITREPYRALGVVVEVDDQGVTVRPLADHRIRVAPAEVAALTADATGEV